MHTLRVDEAQPRLAELIEEANGGVDVVIASGDGSAVRLVPVDLDPRPRFGSGKGLFTLAEDFDEPLQDLAEYER